MAHNWEIDVKRTRMDINVIVWRCTVCGCLQIKTGGLTAPSVYKPDQPGWNPFKTLAHEPICIGEPKPMPPPKRAPADRSTTMAGRQG